MTRSLIAILWLGRPSQERSKKELAADFRAARADRIGSLHERPA
jgi:hypothetical protein